MSNTVETTRPSTSNTPPKTPGGTPPVKKQPEPAARALGNSAQISYSGGTNSQSRVQGVANPPGTGGTNSQSSVQGVTNPPGTGGSNSQSSVQGVANPPPPKVVPGVAPTTNQGSTVQSKDLTQIKGVAADDRTARGLPKTQDSPGDGTESLIPKRPADKPPQRISANTLVNEPNNAGKPFAQQDFSAFKPDLGPFDQRYSAVDTLPKPVKADNGDYLFGTKAIVPSNLVDGYQATREHMLTSEVGRQYLAAYENQGLVKSLVPLEPTQEGWDGGPGFRRITTKVTDVQGNEIDLPVSQIRWNPKQAFVTDTGGFMSPATALAHEMSHAVNFDPEVYERYGKGTLNVINDKFGSYGNFEEMSVIAGPEREIMLANGETPRDSHEMAADFETDGPRSTTIKSAMARMKIGPALPLLRSATNELNRIDGAPTRGDYDLTTADLDRWANDPNVDPELKKFYQDPEMRAFVTEHNAHSAEVAAYRDAISADLDSSTGKVNAMRRPWVIRDSEVTQPTIATRTSEEARAAGDEPHFTGLFQRARGASAGLTGALEGAGGAISTVGKAGGVVGAAAAAYQLGKDGAHAAFAPSGSTERSNAIENLGVHGAQTAGGFAGGLAGGEAGAALGLLGGPAAPVTVPLFALLGSLLGGFGGSWLGGKAAGAAGLQEHSYDNRPPEHPAPNGASSGFGGGSAAGGGGGGGDWNG